MQQAGEQMRLIGNSRMASGTGQVVITGPGSSVPLMTARYRWIGQRRSVTGPAVRFTVAANPGWRSIRTTTASPIAVIINGTVKIVCRNLGNGRCPSIAGDKFITVQHGAVQRRINIPTDRTADKLCPTVVVCFKPHLHGHADRRHGVAFMTGHTAHALGYSVKFMRTGAGRTGRTGR